MTEQSKLRGTGVFAQLAALGRMLMDPPTADKIVVYTASDEDPTFVIAHSNLGDHSDDQVDRAVEEYLAENQPSMVWDTSRTAEYAVNDEGHVTTVVYLKRRAT